MSLRTTLGLSRESSLTEGTPDEQRQAWRERRRAKNAQGIKDRWPEIPSERLVHSRYWIEDTETGNLYREFGGDPGYARTVCAYYLRDGWPVMLEPHDPPSRAEIEKTAKSGSGSRAGVPRAPPRERRVRRNARGRARRAGGRRCALTTTGRGLG